MSLIKWKRKQVSDQKESISGDVDDFIYLLLTLKKIPNKDFTKSPNKIPIPHSLQTSPEFSRSCLIIDDRPKPNSQKLTVEFADKKNQIFRHTHLENPQTLQAQIRLQII